uniref:ZIP family transporter n=1 Tax=Physcomitrium patens TaxID=3218 RepID=A0A7I4BLF6_PHYPA
MPQLGSLDGEKDGAAKLDEKGRAEVNATLLHRASFGDTLLLILALCFHSVFEGIAIGVSVTKQDAWKAFWTITLHKVFAAIAMGIALLRMLPNRPLLSCFCYSFAFAISTPIGIAIGIIIDATTEGAVADWIYAIAMGLATGVFIYVAINHLLGKEYMPSKTSVEQPFKKFIALTLGAATMAIVMIWDA